MLALRVNIIAISYSFVWYFTNLFLIFKVIENIASIKFSFIMLLLIPGPRP